MTSPLWFIKLTHFEYWPTKIFYLPMIPQWIFLAIKTRSLTFFTNINPLMYMSGMFGASKAAILDAIPADYKPVTLLIVGNEVNADRIKKLMEIHALQYPIILKPNVGERGTGVEKIISDAMLETYLQENQGDLILQEFVQANIELGVFYIREPDEEFGKVTSVTLREFMGVRGNGKASIEELMQQEARTRFQLPETRRRMGEGINEILKNDEFRLLEPIGNHCRGTMFVDSNRLINSQLSTVFDGIAKQIDGFYYGRFDLKVNSYEDLYAGKTIKILELNGTNSEPGHVYDPNYSLLKAYRDMYWHWHKMAKISIQQRKRGILPKGFWEVVDGLKQEFGA